MSDGRWGDEIGLEELGGCCIGIEQKEGRRIRRGGGNVRTEKEKDDTHQKKMRIIEIATPESSAADRTSVRGGRCGRIE